MKEWLKPIQALGPCQEAMEWADQFNSLQEAWDACESGSWMVWLVASVAAGEQGSPERRQLVLVACECARLTLPYVPAGEIRPRQAIETAEAWARGEATLEQVWAAGDAARAAAWDAGDAAWAAARDAAWAAGDAAWAAARDAARAAAWAAAWPATLRQCADIVRRHYPEAPDLCLIYS